MFDTFLKPVHEHLDEKGYFAPVPNKKMHDTDEEIGLGTPLSKRVFLIAIYAAAILVAAISCVSVFGSVIG